MRYWTHLLATTRKKFMLAPHSKKRFLLVGQFIGAIALVYGMLAFSLAEWGLVLFLYFVGGCLGGSITYHRLLSHKSWKAPAWWEYIGSLCGAVFLIGSPLAWSNNHMAHHRYVDTDNDPHGPSRLGFWRVQFLSMLYSTDNFKYSVRNLTPFQKSLHHYYEIMHLGIFAALMIFAGWHITALVYLVPSAVIWHMMSLVNNINHTSLGYVHEAGRDSSTNNLVLGYLTFGEGWHANHHLTPAHANFGRAWWEFDLSYQIIRILQK